MKEKQITAVHIAAFGAYLHDTERSPSTIEKYCRNIWAFTSWLDGREVTSGSVVAWKNHLRDRGYCAATVNAMLISLNRFLDFAGWPECRVRLLRLQRRLFHSAERELSREEYLRLVETAYRKGKDRLGLLMETICATGIRVSEVQYITVAATRQGRAEIALKGKIRTILLPRKLCRKLLKYAQKKKIVSGEIFLTRNGTGLSRTQIWSEMKAICKAAGVAASKVFPHNLRHLFARTFYRINHDVALLADLLGHSSIETTRIYLISTGEEHERQLNRLHLLC